MGKYGVLLIGGNRTHQENYGRAFASDPRCHLVGVTDEAGLPAYRDGLNRLLAAELRVPYFEDMDAALARDDVHIVSMCADIERRGRVGVKCAQARKHLYLDKPLAGSAADAEAIAKAVEKAGVRSHMFCFVTAPWAQAAKKAIEEGQVGRLLGLHADMLIAKGRPGTVPPGTVRKEKGEPRQYTFVEAKRELFDMAVYPVSLIHWLAGKRVRTVHAMTGNYFFAEHAAKDVEDFGALLLTLEDGTVATATGGRIGWTSHPRGGVARVIVVGSKGTLTFSDSGSHLEVYNDEPEFVMPPVHPYDPMGMWSSTVPESGIRPKRRWVLLGDEARNQSADMRHFVDCIEQGVEPEMNARMAVHTVEVLMAGYRSATKRGPVTIRSRPQSGG